MNKYCISFIIITIILCSSGLVFAENYQFFFDDKKLDCKYIDLNGDGVTPSKGDLCFIDKDTYFVVGEPGKYVFTKGKYKGTTALINADGSKTIIGAAINLDFNDKNVLINPLLKMNNDEISNLWFVVLNDWNKEIKVKLNHINFEKTCVFIYDTASIKNVLPKLPDKIRYLHTKNLVVPGFEEISSLARYKHLEYLHLDLPEKKIDLKLLEKSKNLKYLSCSGFWNEIENYETLKMFPKLIHLDFNDVKNLENIDFVSALPKLRTLMINGTKVTNIEPALKLKRLMHLDASGCPINKLKDIKVPSLKEIQLSDEGFTKEELEAFKTANPHCKVNLTLSFLKKSLAGVNKVRIREIGIQKIKTLFELQDFDKINLLIRKLVIKKNFTRRGSHCLCNGSHYIDFFKGGELVVSLGLHHGFTVRGHKGPINGDENLTDDSAKFIVNWLAENGVPEPLNEWKEIQKNIKDKQKAESDPTKKAFNGVNKIRVIQGFADTNDIKTLFEIKDMKEINLFLKNFVIDEGANNCNCGGHPGIEFYKDDKLIVYLRLHHGKTVRFRKGPLTGNYSLSKESINFFDKWFDKHMKIKEKNAE